MAQDDLIQSLPVSMEDAVRSTLGDREQIRIALVGAIGEGLVATDKRVAVVKEKDHGNAMEVFAHPFTKVSGASVKTMHSGRALIVETTVPIPDNQRTIFFPAEKTTVFEDAAKRIEELLAASDVSSASRTIDACPECSGPIDKRDVFCPACGTKVRDTCQVCAGPMDSSSGYCPHCGVTAEPAVVQCPSCGARVNSVVMSYCTECGTTLFPKCAACGSAMLQGWSHCRFCGRAAGSTQGAAARGIRAAAERDEQRRREQEQSAEPPESAGDNIAAQHNAKGAELFEEERFEEAVQEFRRAVLLDPNNGSYHCNLAVAYDELDQDEDAMREYERALELNPNDTTALLYMGYMLNESNESERAAELWRRLVEIAPGTAEAEEAQQNLRGQETL